MEVGIHDTIDNESDPDTTGTYTYTVTPFEGIYCEGNPFHVTVMVSPNSGGEITTVTLTNPEPGCANEEKEIKARFSTPVHNVIYRNGASVNMTGDNTNTTFTATVHLPDTCSGDIHYTVNAVDANGCPVPAAQGVLQVRIADWSTSVPAQSTVATPVEITCLRDTVWPAAPASITDCRNQEIIPRRAGVTYSTDNGASWSETPLACSGLVRFTFRYTDCADTSHDWHYVYKVIGNNAGPVVNNPVTDTTSIATGSGCISVYPDLREVFRARMDENSTCTARENVTVTQTPSAGSPVTGANPKVTVTLTDNCQKSRSYDVNIATLSIPVVSADVDSLVACYHGTTSATAVVASGTGTAPFTYKWNTDTEQNDATATDLTARGYTVTVTDANGCRGYAYVTVMEPLPVSFTLSADREEFCAGDSTVLRANNVYGGNYGFTYYWTKNGNAMDLNAAVTPMQVLTDTTIYTLYIKDAKPVRPTCNCRPWPSTRDPS
jgi:hypothetical protein